jgi:hypothetical protein
VQQDAGIQHSDIRIFKVNIIIFLLFHFLYLSEGDKYQKGYKNTLNRQIQKDMKTRDGSKTFAGG